LFNEQKVLLDKAAKVYLTLKAKAGKDSKMDKAIEEVPTPVYSYSLGMRIARFGNAS